MLLLTEFIRNIMKQIIFIVLLLIQYPVFNIQCFTQESFPVDTFMYSPHYYTDMEEAKKDPLNVWYLDLNLQKHKQFPFDICHMVNLKRLDISFNHFAMIPALISNLQQLDWLDISGNYYLNTVPETINKLQNLKELRVTDNRLKAGEIEKIRKGLPNCRVITAK